MTWRVIAEFAGFQAVWLACALGAASGANAPGILAAGTFVAVQIAHKRASHVVLSMLASGLLGLAVESLLAVFGVLRHAGPWPVAHLAPAWIVALWLAFGTTLMTTARLLQPHALPKAAVLGAIFGPLSYVAGVALGALDLTASRDIGLSVIAGVWALSFTGLVALQIWLDARCELARDCHPT